MCLCVEIVILLQLSSVAELCDACLPVDLASIWVRSSLECLGCCAQNATAPCIGDC